MNATDVRTETLAKIETLLKSVNGKRRERTVGINSVLGRLSRVTDNVQFAYVHGGSVANAYTQSAVTTLVLAAKVDGRFYLGIGLASAKGSPTPGRVWKPLQPFGETGPKGKADAKWLEWTKAEGVIELAGPEIDALLETETI